LKKRFAALRSVGIAPGLNQDVEHHAILIDGAPEIVLHALDPDEDFVDVPLVPWPWPTAAQAVGKALAEFLAPAPYGLVGDDDARSARISSSSRRLRLVQPHNMADDLRWEAVAVVRVGWRHHPQLSFVPTSAASPG
jgi:hypothetical protein